MLQLSNSLLDDFIARLAQNFNSLAHGKNINCPQKYVENLLSEAINITLKFVRDCDRNSI